MKPEDVMVHYRSAPDGLTLNDGVITVEEGYDHVVLGPIWVNLEKAYPGFTMKTCQKLNMDRNTIMDELRKRAAREGGNAVVFASSPIQSMADYASDESICTDFVKVPIENQEQIVGSGWAVILVPSAESGSD